MSTVASRCGRKVDCPGCGAEIIIGGRASQRLKCPKCTALIPIGLSQAADKIESGDQAIAALREHIARLEERITALEQQPAQGIPLPTENDPEPTPVSSKLKWIRASEEIAESPGILLPDEIHEKALVHNLRVLSGNRIMIRSAAGNHGARRLAERFKELFAEADWGVNGVAEVNIAPGKRGLALAAGTLPPTRETTRTFLAFTAAGFALEPRLDMSLHSDETMLIVA